MTLVVNPELDGLAWQCTEVEVEASDSSCQNPGITGLAGQGG